ncbi:MAG: DUF805 domain-containing protein [Gammaproteobacteria bacterium]
MISKGEYNMADYNQYQAPKSNVDGVEAGTQQFARMKVLSASGRIGRIRYLAYGFAVFLVIYLVAVSLSAIVALGASGAGGEAPRTVMGFAYILITIYSVMLAIRRSHDFNVTGWLAVLSLIPLINLFFIFVPGTKGANDYGPPPPPNTTGNYILGLGMPIIIAVIGILAAIAIPAYQGYIHKSKQLQQQQLQQSR